MMPGQLGGPPQPFDPGGLVIVTGAAHSAMLTRPELVIDAIDGMSAAAIVTA
jgi:pimeloyl-ACP methyl ester carboxylesterase